MNKEIDERINGEGRKYNNITTLGLGRESKTIKGFWPWKWY